MNPPVYKVRFYLYWFFFLWSILLFALSASRISYTENIPPGDPLNDGIDFFDPSVVALLVSSVLALIFAPSMIFILNTQWTHRYLSVVWVEVIAAFVLWIVWLGSTASATNVWPDLSFCIQWRACTNLQAMIAFAWLGWLSLSVLILVTAVSASRAGAWKDNCHGAWADFPLGFSPAVRMPTPDFEHVGPYQGSAGGPQMSNAGVV
ncbi:hypothetical protein BU17DRAFT_65648 [Hysterangium stoloniferum]|nr:hypothetical protein BU17DRAFT_65648 [Hysterangium stoloniferum]